MAFLEGSARGPFFPPKEGPPRKIISHTTLNLKTFNYPLTTSNAFDHICRQQTYGFA